MSRFNRAASAEPILNSSM